MTTKTATHIPACAAFRDYYDARGRPHDWTCQCPTPRES